MRIYIPRVCAQVPTCVYTEYIYKYISCVCVCVRARMYIYLYIYVYIHILAAGSGQRQWDSDQWSGVYEHVRPRGSTEFRRGTYSEKSSFQRLGLQILLYMYQATDFLESLPGYEGLFFLFPVVKIRVH